MDLQYCELCGKMENLLKCGRCLNSFYCSKEHQIQDWKQHKRMCKDAKKTQTQPRTPEPKQPSRNDKGGLEQLVIKKSADQNDIVSKNLTNSGPLNPSNDGITSEAGSGSVADNLALREGINESQPNGQTQPSPQKLAMEYIVPCMNKHGICVVDSFLGEETGLSLLQDVRALYKTGKFNDGQLVSQRSDSTKDIRGDKITWIEGREPGCERIAFLLNRMDELVGYCNSKMGKYRINERTKVSNPK